MSAQYFAFDAIQGEQGLQGNLSIQFEIINDSDLKNSALFIPTENTFYKDLNDKIYLYIDNKLIQLN